MYRVIVCQNCGRLLLAKKSQKTRCCPHCEARMNPEKTKIVAFAKTSQEASRLIRALKQNKGTREF